MERPYRIPGYPFIPIFAIIGLLGLLVATLLESFVPSMIGLGVLVIGFIIYNIWMKNNQ